MLLQLSVQSVGLFLYVILGDLGGGKPDLYVYFFSWTWLGANVAPIPAPMAMQTPLILADSSLDPTTLIAIISALAALLAALAAWISIYQTRQSRKIERQRDEQQRLHEQEMELFRRDLEASYREKEQERQREEAARLEMLVAQNNVAEAGVYRNALHVDPRISRLQILDMRYPLEVANIYVCMRVHEDTVMRYDIDQALAVAARQRDPDHFSQAWHHYLENRFLTAIDPAAAIRKYRHCVIVGDPGSGKTMLLKYLTLTLADGKYPDLSDLPIHVELNAFVSSAEEDMLAYVARRWEQHSAFPREDAQSYMETMLKDGKAILLLDALDETVVGEQTAQSDVLYQRACNAIISLATRYPLAHIVVTARKADYQQHRPLDGFTVVEVMGFRRADIRRFVENWLRHTQGVANTAGINDLIMCLDQNPRIQSLAVSPLLLSLIVFVVYEAKLTLPDRRVELYRRCVDVLLTDWDARRNIRRQRTFKPDQKQQLLTEVAWHFHQLGQCYFPEQDLLTEIAHCLPVLGLSAEDKWQVLQEIMTESGLLKEQARGQYSFLHLSLQEYFAATAVNNQSRFATLVSQYADPWWEEVLLLYAGQTSDASPLLLNLLGEDSTYPRKDDLFRSNLLIAGRCLASAPTIRREDLPKKVTDAIIECFTQTPRSHLRSQMREILGTIGGHAITSELVKLLENKETPLRRDLALILNQLGKGGTVAQEWVEMLNNNQIDVEIRAATALALGELGERSIVPKLVSMLNDDQLAVKVREAIALALGKLGDQAVAQNLMKVLKEGEDQLPMGMCKAIAKALGEIGQQQLIVPELMKLLKNSNTDSPLREAIVEALGKLGAKRVVPELMEMLKNSNIDQSLCKAIAEALGELGDPSVVPELIRMVESDQIGDWVRKDIALVLGRLGDQSLIPDLMKLLNSKLPARVHIAIVEALGMLGEKSVMSELLGMIDDREIDKETRSRMTRVLGNLVEGEQMMATCIFLFNKTDEFEIADAIYSALWTISRREKVRIVVRADGSFEIERFVS